MAEREPGPSVTLTGRDLDVLVQVAQQAARDGGGARTVAVARRLKAVRRWLTPRAAADGVPVTLDPDALDLLAALARDADHGLALRLRAAGGPPAAAPAPPPAGTAPRVGDRVRLTHPDGTTVEGRWVVVLETDGGDLHRCDADSSARVDLLPPGSPSSSAVDIGEPGEQSGGR